MSVGRIRGTPAILALMMVTLEAFSYEESWTDAMFQNAHLTVKTHADDLTKRSSDIQTTSNNRLVVDDKGLFTEQPQNPTQTTDSNLSRDQKSSSPRCNKYGRKKRSRYKLSDELNKKEPGRDILAQLDYDIEEQEMDKRSRIELLSYLDAALKNKNIELNMELRHLAKEEKNLNDKEQVEYVNSNAAVLTANIQQLNKRIKDLDERTLRMKKMKDQKLLERIPENLNMFSRQNYLNALHQPPSAKETSELPTAEPFRLTETVQAGKPELLVKDSGTISKQSSRKNFGYVPYQMPMPYADPLQILRLTNPDFAALAQPSPWLNSGWVGYGPNSFPYPIERQYPQSLYAALSRNQALPIPMRKV